MRSYWYSQAQWECVCPEFRCVYTCEVDAGSAGCNACFSDASVIVYVCIYVDRYICWVAHSRAHMFAFVLHII